MKAAFLYSQAPSYIPTDDILMRWFRSVSVPSTISEKGIGDTNKDDLYYSTGVRSASTSIASLQSPLQPLYENQWSFNALEYLAELELSLSIVYSTEQSSVGKVFASNKLEPQCVIQVYDKRTRSTWRHTRETEICLALLNDFMSFIHPDKHFCLSDCPWLYSYLKRLLQTSTGASNAISHAVGISPISVPDAVRSALHISSSNKSLHAQEAMCMTINRCINTLKLVLLRMNRTNCECNVLGLTLAHIFMKFLQGNSYEPGCWKNEEFTCSSPVVKNLSIFDDEFYEIMSDRDSDCDSVKQKYWGVPFSEEQVFSKKMDEISSDLSFYEPYDSMTQYATSPAFENKENRYSFESYSTSALILAQPLRSAQSIKTWTSGMIGKMRLQSTSTVL